ncbi:unnamed protein product, partial [Effrenium voratum]
MEVGFWRFLTEPDADGLPLKQRIPEVALFRGCSLLAGFYSNQRGLLQKRASCSKQFLLDRLLALSTKTADARDLCAQTPVAILRHHAGAPCVPKAQVLSASQLMELLERTERGQAPRAANGLPHLGEEEWSLQSLVLPPSNLRIVSVYSREPNGDESWDVVGQAFTQAYPLSNAPWQGEVRRPHRRCRCPQPWPRRWKPSPGTWWRTCSASMGDRFSASSRSSCRMPRARRCSTVSGRWS